MTDSSSTAPSAGSGGQPEATQTQVIYRERQWVPWYWWLLAAGLVALTSAQLALNRNIWWLIGSAVILGAVAVWVLLYWSRTVVQIEQDADGSRWLIVGEANLPADVVSRSLAVPATAKRNAMGRQLDPAAFVVSHGWVPEMVMLVLDDPDDPTPYWLLTSRNPEKLLEAFLPGQTEDALKHMPKK